MQVSESKKRKKLRRNGGSRLRRTGETGVRRRCGNDRTTRQGYGSGAAFSIRGFVRFPLNHSADSMIPPPRTSSPRYRTADWPGAAAVMPSGKTSLPASNTASLNFEAERTFT